MVCLGSALRRVRWGRADPVDAFWNSTFEGEPVNSRFLLPVTADRRAKCVRTAFIVFITLIILRGFVSLVMCVSWLLFVSFVVRVIVSFAVIL